MWEKKGRGAPGVCAKKKERGLIAYGVQQSDGAHHAMNYVWFLVDRSIDAAYSDVAPDIASVPTLKRQIETNPQIYRALARVAVISAVPVA
jgi:hypothetical protein